MKQHRNTQEAYLNVPVIWVRTADYFVHFVFMEFHSAKLQRAGHREVFAEI